MSWLQAGLLGMLLGFAGGWQVCDWRNGAAKADRVDRVIQAEKQQEVQVDQAATRYEQAREQVRAEFQIIYRDRDRVVEKPIYRNVCLDADGLRLIRRAITDQAESASEPSPALP